MRTDKIYFDYSKTLWIGYAQGSGYTYDRLGTDVIISNDGAVGVKDQYFCDRLSQIKEGERPDRMFVSEFSSIRLYKVPVYGKKVDIYSGERYNIFGGEINPTSFVYMSITNYGEKRDRVIINFFKTYKEAKGFHQF